MRGHKVIVDADLAVLYGGVSTKVLNRAVKRNANRFPRDFLFALSPEEKVEVVTNCDHLRKLKFLQDAGALHHRERRGLLVAHSEVLRLLRQFIQRGITVAVAPVFERHQVDESDAPLRASLAERQ